MILNVKTVLVIAATIQLVNVTGLLYLKSKFNFVFKGYNSFITFFALSALSTLALLLRAFNPLSIYMMLYMFINVFSLFFMLNGFLKFYHKAFSRLIYFGLILMYTIIIHIAVLNNASSYFYFTLLIIHDFAVHGYILFVNIRDGNLQKDETHLIAILNILFIITTFIYAVLLVLDFNNVILFVQPEVFYEFIIISCGI